MLRVLGMLRIVLQRVVSRRAPAMRRHVVTRLVESRDNLKDSCYRARDWVPLDLKTARKRNSSGGAGSGRSRRRDGLSRDNCRSKVGGCSTSKGVQRARAHAPLTLGHCGCFKLLSFR
jgi:hypothetical protein